MFLEGRGVKVKGLPLVLALFAFLLLVLFAIVGTLLSSAGEPGQIYPHSVAIKVTAGED